MVFFFVRIFKRVALALFRHRVNQDRPEAFCVAHVLQDRHQAFNIVAVHRAHIVEAQLFKQRAAKQHGAGELVGPLGGFLDVLGKAFGQMLADIAQRKERAR